MKIDTHTKIDTELCGTPLEVGEGFSRVEFHAIDRMAVDESVMVYGRFVFRLADYAAMIEVNHPNVVLGAADVLLMLPVRTDDTLMEESKVGVS